MSEALGFLPSLYDSVLVTQNRRRDLLSAPLRPHFASLPLLPIVCSKLPARSCSKLLPDHLLTPLHQTPLGPLLDRSLDSQPARQPASHGKPAGQLASEPAGQPAPAIRTSPGWLPGSPGERISSPESLVTQNRRIEKHYNFQGFFTIDSFGACIVSAKFSTVIFAIKTN